MSVVHARLIGQLAAAKAEIKNLHKQFGCELRDPCGTIWDYAAKLKIALADAIRRPMGVVPASAEGLVTDQEIQEAEIRRAAAAPIRI